MIKRLVIGLVKGLVIGGAIGAGFHYGLRFTEVGFLLGLLIAMGTGASAAVLSGKPPWKQEAWIEALLKAAFGLGLGAVAYWLAQRYADVALFAPIPDLPKGVGWTHLPLLFSPAIGGLFGALVELDNSDPGESSKKGPESTKRQGVKARVAKLSGEFEPSKQPRKNRMRG